MTTNTEQLRYELTILNRLGFEEIKPLLWCKHEAMGTIYFDYRTDNKRQTYAIDNKMKPLDKKYFESYTLFKMKTRHL